LKLCTKSVKAAPTDGDFGKPVVNLSALLVRLIFCLGNNGEVLRGNTGVNFKSIGFARDFGEGDKFDAESEEFLTSVDFFASDFNSLILAQKCST
jgi:hypothetical protein